MGHGRQLGPRTPVKAVLFDAYGTLLRNDELTAVPRRIVTDHGLSASVEDVQRLWLDLYSEATQAPPFRTLRAIHTEILTRLLAHFAVDADATPYVDLFFQLTTTASLYPDALPVLRALGPVRAAVVTNADREHLAGWTFTLPVEFILLSEAVRAYKPSPLMFQSALARLGLEPQDVLHVGDSEVDDVRGAQAAGLRVAWINRGGRPRRADVPAPDFEITRLAELLALL